MVADGGGEAVNSVPDGGGATARAAVDAVAVIVVCKGGAVGDNAGDTLGGGEVVEVTG